MKKISKILALSVSALLLFTGCAIDGDADYEGEDSEDTEQTENGGTKNSGSTTGTGNSNGSGNTGAGEVTYTALPIIPVGNQKTQIQGAGIMIYVDNTNLKITGANASEFVPSISITDTTTNESVAFNAYEWSDYNAEESLRLYITLPDAEHTNLSVEVKVQINGTWYKGTAVFVDGVYQFDYEVTGITMTPSTAEIKPGDTVTLAVKDTTYGLDITKKCTFTVSPESAGTVSNGLFAAASDAENGDVTVTAKYSDEITAISTITINSSALPTVMSNTKIQGSGIEVYISKDVIADVPSKEDLTITGSLTTTDANYKNYESSALTLTVVEVNDQGTKMRIYFTQPAGFPDGIDITEKFNISWTGVSINVEFNGNALTKSAITISE